MRAIHLDALVRLATLEADFRGRERRRSHGGLRGIGDRETGWQHRSAAGQRSKFQRLAGHRHTVPQRSERGAGREGVESRHRGIGHRRYYVES